MADDVAVAVEEGDGEIAAIAPIFLGSLEGRLGKGQHQDGADGAPGQAFADEFDDDALPAATRKRRKKMVMSSQISASGNRRSRWSNRSTNRASAASGVSCAAVFLDCPDPSRLIFPPDQSLRRRTA
jgi:hypothetical protein